MTNSLKDETIISSSKVEGDSTGDEKVANEIQNPHFGTDFEKKVIRRLDLRLILPIALCYGTSLMDRSNLPNARIAGAGEDLNLDVGQRYSIISLVFFPAYIITELPANLLIKKLPPSLFLGSLTICFGIIMLCFGFVHDWKILIALRFLLGFFEGGLLPGIIYLISSWYLRNEVGVRMTTFYLFGQICSSVSNPLAYAFSLADGSGGFEGWRYIFIIFGCITVFCGILGVSLLPAFPEKSTLFNDEAKQLILDRLNRDRGDAEMDKTTLKGVLQHSLDWKILIFGITFSLITLSAYAHSYFLPIILRNELGFSVKNSQILTMCPYLFAVAIGISISFWSDRLLLRGPFICCGFLVTIIGLCLLAFAPQNGVRFAGAFLSLPGTHTSLSLYLVWKANNVVGSLKRACSSAIITIFGGIGGIVASVSYNQNDAPDYTAGILTTITAQAVGFILTILMMLYFNRKNKQSMAGQLSKPLEGKEGFYYIL